ncbi:TRAP transporter large permease [Vibrio sp. TH_r3]|uniref:TRAP transporter large permease n=1 Tax=unclassified Vibrio TaxID=2614977 RepID=UPI0029534BA6|nr:TRAP transporter large permease [Vibrio sp. TH_r3]MDV7105100.1 TRAP transporter large permease [Vibrio sp. TH_r3]
MSIIVLFLILLFLGLIGLPIAFALPLSAIIFITIEPSLPISIVVQRMSVGIDSYVLLAIPLFIFAGNLLNFGGLAEKIFNFALALVGHIRGSLAHVNVIASVIFSGMSGVAQADAAGLGTVEVKAMTKAGFSPEFSAAITAASSIIGPIIPPSGIMIIYSVLSGTSIPELFVAGIIPGLSMALVLMLTIYYLARTGKVYCPEFERQPVKQVWAAFKEGFLPLMAPVLLIAGILTGVATPTELGALTVAYSIILGAVYRELTLNKLLEAAKQTCVTCGALVFIIAAAVPFSAILALLGIPHALAEFLTGISDNPMVILLLINIALIILGCLLDTTAILLITVPILMPVIITLGIDPVHFGLIVIINLLIGTITPPFGVLLFVMMGVANVSYNQMFSGIKLFYIPLFLFLLILTYVPAFSLWLPSLVF